MSHEMPVHTGAENAPPSGTASPLSVDDLILQMPPNPLSHLPAKRETVESKAGISMHEALTTGWVPDLKGKTKFAFYSREILLGVIICMAQIPESIAFAFLARVRAPIALHSAWVVGIVCSLLGGRPGMVNGATGAFAAIISTFLEEPKIAGGNGGGIELLFPSVMLAGALMIVVWLLKLDRFITMLPLPVMIGFCNGLAIVIGVAQLHPFQAPVCDDSAKAGRRLASGTCTESGWKEGAELGFMLLIAFVAMSLMEFVPKIPKPSAISEKPMFLRPFAWIALILLELPSSMLSIVGAIVLEFAIIRPAGFHTDTIGDVSEFTAADAMPVPFFLDSTNYDLATLGQKINNGWGTIIQQAILLAAVGCIESLMTAEVVSNFTKTSHHSGLVVAAMGLGNIISGFFGGMGGNAMIGLSTIACIGGGRGRVAPFATAAGIVICISAAYQVLNYIPMSALAGIMIVVVLHTFKWFSPPMLVAALLPEQARGAGPAWHSGDDGTASGVSAMSKASGATAGSQASKGWKLPLGTTFHRKVIRSDVGIIVTVTVLVFFTNIVLAVGIGLALACAAFAWESSSHLSIVTYEDTDANGKRVKVYNVEGPLFFAAARRLVDAFNVQEDPDEVIVQFQRGAVLDYTFMDSLAKLTSDYNAAGKTIAFHRLTERSVRMLRKAHHITKEVRYQQVAEGDFMPSVGQPLGRPEGLAVEP